MRHMHAGEDTTPVQYLAQREPYDCAVAANAMALGLSYEEVRKYITPLDENLQAESQDMMRSWKSAGYPEDSLPSELLLLLFFRQLQEDRLYDDYDFVAVRSSGSVMREGSRYIATICMTDQIYHAVCIDEMGRVFDPDYHFTNGKVFDSYSAWSIARLKEDDSSNLKNYRLVLLTEIAKR